MNILMRVAGAACLLLTGMQAVEAQTAWPNRPIKVSVPFPAGGQLDVVMRSVTDKLSPIASRPDDELSPELPQVGMA